MHPFALARANDPATAIAAHADDPELAFIAGRPDLIGLMKDRAALPIEALPAGGCIQPPPAMAATAYDKIYREGKKVLMNILDIEAPLIAAVNGPVRLHSEYILLADIVLASPSTVFQDKPHFEFGIVPGDGVNLLWQEVIGSVRGRYFILTRQELDAETAKEWGAVNEIVPANKLLARAREIAEGLAKLPRLTSSYTRIALTQKLRRIID